MNELIHGWRARPFLRTVVAIGLLASYAVLAGEAIHCQYFASSSGHHGDGHSHSLPTGHTMQCLLADHGSSVTVDSPSVTGVPLLHLVGAIIAPEYRSPVSAFTIATPARAPPAV